MNLERAPAGHCGGNAEDLIEGQDEIAAVIVNALRAKLTRKVYKRSPHKRPEALDAHDPALRALVFINAQSPRKLVLRGEATLATRIDPEFAPAHALMPGLSRLRRSFAGSPIRRLLTSHKLVSTY